jgi:photosystem II stability/assembly factor-like uncharacterized protein
MLSSLPSLARCVACAAVFFLASAEAFAETPSAPYAWSSVPFGGGGFVSGLVFHRKVPDLLYARTDVGGAYRWNPAAKSWIPLNDDLARNDAELYGVLSIALDPNDGSKVYLACGEYLGQWGHKAAILRSADRGMTWERSDLPIKLGGNSDGRSTGERLQVDPHNSGILFLGTSQDGLWKSTDGGKSWSSVSGFPGTSATFVLFDRRSEANGSAESTLYVGVADTKNPSLYRSRDGGASWEPVPGAPQGLMPHRASIDASGVLYLAYSNDIGPNNIADGAVWKFDPTSGGWTDVTPEKPGAVKFGYSGISADSRNAGTVVVSTLDRWGPGDDIFRTTDGGKTWTALGPKSIHHADNAPWLQSYSRGKDAMGHWIGDVEIDPFHPDTVAYVTGYGLWRTEHVSAIDTGGHIDWSFAVDGLEETVPVALASPPRGPHLVTALGDVAGASYMSPSIDKIDSLNVPVSESNRSIDFAEAAPAYMVRASDGAASGYFSIDSGATWKGLISSPRVERGTDRRYHTAGHIAVSAGAGYLVWAPEHQPAYYSDDHGVSWHESSGWPQSDSETFIPVSDRAAEGVFYVMNRTNGDMYASVDGGKTFTLFAHGAPAWGGEMRAVPGHVRALWVPTPNGLYYSPDANSAFSAIKGVSEAYAVGLGKPAPGHDDPAIFLAGKIKKTVGLFRSDDSGESWVRINDDRHQFGWISSIVGDPRIYGRVYLATGGRGVIKGDIATAADQSLGTPQ